MLDPLQTSSPGPAVMSPHWDGEEGEWRTSPWELMQLVVRLLLGVRGPANISNVRTFWLVVFKGQTFSYVLYEIVDFSVVYPGGRSVLTSTWLSLTPSTSPSASSVPSVTVLTRTAPREPPSTSECLGQLAET